MIKSPRQKVFIYLPWFLITTLGAIELHRLIGIRFTTNDDALGLIWGYQWGVWNLALDAMHRYGRIQQFLYYPLWLLTLRLEDSGFYDLLHYGTLAAAHVAIAYAAILYLGNRFAAVFALVYVSTVALVWEYNLLTSYPLATFLSILVGTLALILLHFYRGGGSKWLAPLSLFLLGLSFFNYEFMPFIFTALYVTCLFEGVSLRRLWLNNGTSAPEFRLALAALSLLIFYLIAYFLFRSMSSHTYDGTQFAEHLRLLPVLETAIGLSIRSSIYAWLWTPYTFSASEFLDGKTITYSAELPLGLMSNSIIIKHLPKAFMSGIAGLLLLRPGIQIRRSLLFGGSLIGIFIMFFPNVLIALTDKYQAFYLEHGVRYYAYTSISHFGFALLVSASLIALLQALNGRRFPQTAVSCAGVLLLAVGGFYSSYSNAIVAKSMQANSDRWRAFDLILRTPTALQVVRSKTVVAPKLWDRYWEISLRPTYWKEVANAKYGEHIEFQSELNKSRSRTVFFDFVTGCGGFYSLLSELSPADYTGTKLHIVTTQPVGNSFLRYRSVHGEEGVIHLRSTLKGGSIATIVMGAFDPSSVNIYCDAKGDVK